MPDPKNSPAVQSMLDEQSAQREAAKKGNLETGLEDSFPASDPVSATHTSVSSGRTDVGEADRIRDKREDDSYPLVDEALRSVGDAGRSAGGNVRALRRDAERISESAGEIASGAAGLTKAKARAFWSDIEDRVRARPLSAVGIVAALAFVWGASR
jgi:ElaB/YqjD/DUF883 family membrane-anchored ribosome-binding protein